MLHNLAESVGIICIDPFRADETWESSPSSAPPGLSPGARDYLDTRESR